MAGGRRDTRDGELRAHVALGAAPAGPVERPGPEVRRHRRAQRSILAVVAVAGALGALARDGVGHLVHGAAGQFPWGTFWTNVAGSFLIGLVLVLLTERFPGARVARPLVVTGFLGAFTTFSTYVVGADLLVRDHAAGIAAAYAIGSVVAGAIAALLGILLGRFLSALDRSLGEQLR